MDAVDAVNKTTLAYAAQDSDLVSVAFGVVDVGATTVTKRQAVTVRNTGSSPVTYATGFSQASTAGGATVTVSPKTVTVPAGRSQLVTVTLTADPATLAKELDPTSSADSGVGVPRDFVSSVSGRVVLTPTDGGSELRVPVSQGWEMHNALLRMGVPTELAIYPREPHFITERHHQRDLLERMLAWFDRYVQG